MAITSVVSKTVNSYAGSNINDGTIYIAKLSDRSNENGGIPASVSILSPRPGKAPKYVRSQQKERRVVLSVTIKTFTLANIEALHKIFAHDQGEQYLIVTDSASVQRRILAAVESFLPSSTRGDIYTVTLLATSDWEAVTPVSSSASITASGQTEVLANAGTEKAYPIFVIEPQSLMDHDDSWIRRRRLIVVNRSQLPVDDPVGDGWPIDVTASSFDAATLQGASRIQNDMDDLRVYHNGREINRWLNPATANATQHVWANLRLAARKTATNLTAMTAGSPATGASIATNNPTGLVGWPKKGFALFEDEVIYYGDRTDSTFLDITRGALGTTAASHSASTTCYWVEHPFMFLLYDYTAATNPNPPDDRKPRIDLATSSNGQFKWISGFLLNEDDRRSAAWQRQFIPTGGHGDEFITLYKSGNYTRFEDTLPNGNAPNYTALSIKYPYGADVLLETVWDADEVNIDSANELDSKSFMLLVKSLDRNGNLTISQYVDVGAINVAHSTPRYGFTIQCHRHVICGTDPTDVYAADYVLSTTDHNSISFVNDKEGAVLTKALIRLKKSGGATKDVHVGIYTDVNGTPGSLVSETLGLIDEAVIGTSYDYHIVTFSDAKGAALEAGQRYHLVINATPAGSGTITIGMWQARNRARFYSVEAMNAQLHENFDVRLIMGVPDTNSFPKGNLSVAQEDVPVRTGDYRAIGSINIDAIDEVAFPLATPYIKPVAEESLYLMNCRLKNDTTGQYLDIYYPLKFGQSIQIDCANHRVIDSETGLDIPFICTPSDPINWLYLVPGNNTISYTESGVVDTTLNWEYRPTWQS